MRRIESPVEKWPGYILLLDPIPLIAVADFEDVMQSIDRTKFTEASTQKVFVPVILPCVAEWHLEGFPDNVTVETFPGTPRAASSILVSTLVTAITRIYRGDEEADPNALRRESLPTA